MKTIVDKKIPFWAKPLRFIYRKLVRILFKENTLRQVESNGLFYLVWSGEDIGKKMLLTRNFEPDETAVFSKMIQPGDLCVDIGGNIGYYSLNFAKMCGASGRVVTFEPIRRNELVINLAAEINGMRNIEVINEAVSDRRAELTMEIPDNDGAYAYLSEVDADDKHVAVQTRTLDDNIVRLKISRVDILKIDVEGAEMLVLKGAQQLLSDSERRPRLVMIELCDEFLGRFGSKVVEVLSLMERYSYKPHKAAKGGLLTPFTNNDINNIFNVFFLHS